MRELRRRDKECGMKDNCVDVIREREEDLHGESCFGFVVMVVVSC